jgi:hypothetical protein
MTVDQLNADADAMQSARIDEINDTKEIMSLDAAVPLLAITEALTDGAVAIELITYLVQGAE